MDARERTQRAAALVAALGMLLMGLWLAWDPVEPDAQDAPRAPDVVTATPARETAAPEPEVAEEGSPDEPISLEDAFCIASGCAEIACRLSQLVDPAQSSKAALTLEDGSRRMVVLQEPDVAWLWFWQPGSGTLSIPGYEPVDIRWTARDGDTPGHCIPDPVPLRDASSVITGRVRFTEAPPEGRIQIQLEGCEHRITVPSDGHFTLEVRPQSCVLRALATWQQDPPEGTATYTLETEKLGWASAEVSIGSAEVVQVDLPLMPYEVEDYRHVSSQMTRFRTSDRPGHLRLLGEELDEAGVRSQIEAWGCEACAIEIDASDPHWVVEVYDPLDELIFALTVEDPEDQGFP